MSDVPTDAKTDAPTLAYEGNCSLKMVVGKDFKLHALVTEQQVRACERLLKKSVDNFFVDAEADLSKLEKITRTASPDGLSPLEMQELQACTYNIKTMAKVLGFSLISEICVHIANSLDHPKLVPLKKRELLKTLVEGLRLACNRKIRDDGGAIGQEILDSLRAHATAA